MCSLNPFTNWFFRLFQPLTIDPIVTGSLISGGAKLFASLFGDSGSKVPPEAQRARQLLLAFAQGGFRTKRGRSVADLEKLIAAGGFFDDPNNPAQTKNIREKEVGIFKTRLSALQEKNKSLEGLFPEEEILEKSFGAISSRINRQKQGASAKFASLGLDPRSGLAQQGLSGIQRTEAGLRGGARTDVSLAKSQARMSALRALLGLPSQQTGLDVPNTVASIGGDISQTLLLKSLFSQLK